MIPEVFLMEESLTMSEIKLSRELCMQIISYLAKQPWAQVDPLIDALEKAMMTSVQQAQIPLAQLQPKVPEQASEK